MELSWHKRRIPKKENKVVEFEVIDFKKVNNEFCKLRVIYENGEEKIFLSRIIHSKPQSFYKDQREKWIVDGMHVAVYAYD